MNPFDLSGRSAIVTGSSRGIGRAIAEAMAAAGANVVISGRNAEPCEQAAAEICSRYGTGRAVAIPANISSKEALANLVERTRAAFGRIDVLVCNAATNPHYGPMASITDEQFRQTFDNNVLANHWLIQMVAPEMRQRRAGAIVVVSSIAGLIGTDVIGAYNISKAADFQLVRNLAVEFGPDNVRINAIAPGVIRTEFARKLWDDDAAQDELNRRTPLRRIGEPEDIAGPAVFLASDASRYMTGHMVVVDGGSTIKGQL
jgi:NAD(P)-dependent dehydrogenase (short-subunit alcohol dehydrogenase family)